jgi:hypothetical protein
LTPASRAKLGLDMTGSFDLAEHFRGADGAAPAPATVLSSDLVKALSDLRELPRDPR